MNEALNIFTRGFVKENPVTKMLLGLCPVLAVTTSAINGLGMGLATTFVLLGSNVVISLASKAIPNTVRIPSFILVIATFVTIVDLLIQAFFSRTEPVTRYLYPADRRKLYDSRESRSICQQKRAMVLCYRRDRHGTRLYVRTAPALDIP